MRRATPSALFRRSKPALAVAVACVTAALSLSPPAAAQLQARSEPDGDTRLSLGGNLSWNLGIVSDYRFRGISQTFRDPALQGGLEFKMPSNFYLGTFASMIDKEIYANSRGFEWDLYGGYRFQLNRAVAMDVGLIQYMYPMASRYSTLEAYIGATWRWLTAKYFHTLSNKSFGNENAKYSGYFNLAGVFPLRDDFRLQASYGFTNVRHNGGDNMDYMVGVAKDWRGMTWGLSLVGTDVDAAFTNRSGTTRNLGERGFVLSASKTF